MDQRGMFDYFDKRISNIRDAIYEREGKNLEQMVELLKRVEELEKQNPQTTNTIPLIPMMPHCPCCCPAKNGYKIGDSTF